MSALRTHITLPVEVLTELDQLVDKRHRSRFIADAVRKELLLARQREALRLAAGCWKDKDHPELRQGASAWTRSEEHTSELQSLRHLVCRLLLDTSTSEIYTLSLHDALPICQREALRLAAGCWKDKDHPELRQGASAWTRKLHRESERRFRKQFSNP